MIWDDLSRIFLNDFPNHPPQTITDKVDVFDIKYDLNSCGYRGEEFSKNTEVLVLGCSQTYGAGLPYDDVWVSLLSNKLNLKFANLAQNGESTTGQIIKAFYYFQKFGNPKMIVALFPIYRMPTAFVPDKMEKYHDPKWKDLRREKWRKSLETADVSGNRFEDYSKAPHNPESVIPKEMAFFYDNAMIDILRQYCKSNNIKLVWSIWDNAYQNSIYKQINDFYPEHHEEYCFIEAFDWYFPNSRQVDLYGEHNALDCHMEHRHKDFFYKAADRKAKGHCHWGTHKNMHIAEAFYNHIILKNLN